MLSQKKILRATSGISRRTITIISWQRRRMRMKGSRAGYTETTEEGGKREEGLPGGETIEDEIH